MFPFDDVIMFISIFYKTMYLTLRCGSLRIVLGTIYDTLSGLMHVWLPETEIMSTFYCMMASSNGNIFRVTDPL